MFDRFLANYPITLAGEEGALLPLPNPRPDRPIRGWVELFTRFPGATFGNGIYRLHTPDRAVAHQLVRDAFPKLAYRYQCFAYDRLGRQFALDFEREKSDEPAISIVDFVDHEIYEIPEDLMGFHNDTLDIDSEPAVASSLFAEWAAQNPQALPLKRNQIVGYRIPLSLGGKHEVANMVVEDMDVSLEFERQIRKGSRIRKRARRFMALTSRSNLPFLVCSTPPPHQPAPHAPQQPQPARHRPGSVQPPEFGRRGLDQSGRRGLRRCGGFCGR
jgi:hypothetical protein